MAFIKTFGVLVLLASIAGVALVAPPILYGQNRLEGPPGFAFVANRSEIGVSVREVEGADRQPTGVVIEDVEPNGPGEKAGLKPGDTVVTFDGEHVRSVRQFTRLVEETRPEKTVDASVLRDGKTVDVRITPTDDRRADWLVDGDGLRARLGEWNSRIRSFSFDVDPSRPHLGVTVQELPSQLAAYFGAASGVLVAGVTDASPAARAGIKAGDVITSFNGDPVGSRLDLVRAVSSASSRSPGDVSIGIVRDKKVSTLSTRLDPVDKRL